MNVEKNEFGLPLEYKKLSEFFDAHNITNKTAIQIEGTAEASSEIKLHQKAPAGSYTLIATFNADSSGIWIYDAGLTTFSLSAGDGTYEFKITVMKLIL